MSNQPLRDLWDASANQPFSPTVSKNSHFVVGFSLLFVAFMLSGLFGLSECPNPRLNRCML